jgi:hypothetical protein
MMERIDSASIRRNMLDVWNYNLKTSITGTSTSTRTRTTARARARKKVQDYNAELRAHSVQLATPKKDVPAT